jgi:ATP-dependent Clp protease ATP-binding subunit ClpA
MPSGSLEDVLVTALQQALQPLQAQISGLRQDQDQLRQQLSDLVQHQAQATSTLEQVTTGQSRLQQTLAMLLQGLDSGSSSDNSSELQILLATLVTRLNTLSQLIASDLELQKQSLRLLETSLSRGNSDDSDSNNESSSATPPYGLNN